MTAVKPSYLVPKLRFPDFRNAGDWHFQPLGDIAEPISEKVGTSKCVPMSVTTGVGLLSQEEKFGRTIAGNSYKNYNRLQTNDFAYNKSATKEFPQGYIARYSGTRDAAVPNSIFTCFRPDATAVIPEYLDHLLHGNYHGRWLCKYITVSARAHGALSVSDDALMSMPVPLPPVAVSRPEQQKIADCLGSLDDLIAAEGRKLEALRQHKQGLMQQLFPHAGETQPRLRFPEFQDMQEWRVAPLGKLFETTTGGTPDRARPDYWGGEVPWVTTSIVDFNVIDSTKESISIAALDNSSAKVFPKQTVLMALYGQGKTRGKVAMLGVEAATNQACAAILPSDEVDPRFVFLNLSGRYEEIRAISNSGGQKNLSQALVRDLPFAYPKERAEQHCIAECLTALDDQTAAQARKLETLKEHKRGLLQQLFPKLETT